jgi:hypothetical protein
MINYDGRRFGALGAIGEPAVAVYHQRGDLLWGEFSGGQTRRGALCGLCMPNGELEFAYTSVLTSGEVISGHCFSTPRLLDDGRILLHEKWERFGQHAATGESEIAEL